MRQDIEINWPEMVAVLLNKLSPDEPVAISRLDIAAVQTRFGNQAAVLQTIAYEPAAGDNTSPLLTMQVVPYKQALQDNESMGELH